MWAEGSTSDKNNNPKYKIKTNYTCTKIDFWIFEIGYYDSGWEDKIFGFRSVVAMTMFLKHNVMILHICQGSFDATI